MRLTRTNGTHTVTHRIPICSHFPGFVLNYPRSIDSKIVWLMLQYDFFLDSLIEKFDIVVAGALFVCLFI